MLFLELVEFLSTPQKFRIVRIVLHVTALRIATCDTTERVSWPPFDPIVFLDWILLLISAKAVHWKLFTERSSCAPVYHWAIFTEKYFTEFFSENLSVRSGCNFEAKISFWRGSTFAGMRRHRIRLPVSHSVSVAQQMKFFNLKIKRGASYFRFKKIRSGLPFGNKANVSKAGSSNSLSRFLFEMKKEKKWNF